MIRAKKPISCNNTLHIQKQIIINKQHLLSISTSVIMTFNFNFKQIILIRTHKMTAHLSQLNRTAFNFGLVHNRHNK